jgi:NADP-dependent aldehyde dehydrogenase
MTQLASFNPRTGASNAGSVPITGAAELNAVVAAAAAAAPHWRAMPATQRADALANVAAALDANADELVELADSETALGPDRLRGEVARTSSQLRMFSDVLYEGSYVGAVLTPGDAARAQPDLRRMLVPLGPVAVFSASNFPLAFSVAGGDTASALAAGCPVIVKAHEGHPLTSAGTAAVVTDALAAVGAMPGLLGVVYGADAGAALVKHPGVQAVGFTGSEAGGRALYDLACARPDPIPFYGELGSVNPVVLLPGALAARAADIARGYVESLLLGSGQFCTNPGLLFTPADDELLDAITREVRMRTGGPMLTARIRDGYLTATTTPEWESTALLAEGGRAGGWAVAPQVRTVRLTQFATDLEHLATERFGPAGLIVTYDTVQELLPVLSALPGSLTASVHGETHEVAQAAQLVDVLARRAGRLIWNGWPTGVAVCWAMHHGGPWPASTSAAHTSVGAMAINRWLTPVAYQNWPEDLLPAALRTDNPLNLRRIAH